MSRQISTIYNCSGSCNRNSHREINYWCCFTSSLCSCRLFSQTVGSSSTMPPPSAIFTSELTIQCFLSRVFSLFFQSCEMFWNLLGNPYNETEAGGNPWNNDGSSSLLSADYAVAHWTHKKLVTWIYINKINQWRIQDFPEEGAPTLRGAPTYDFAKFSQKLHEIERIWTPGGGASKILLCRSATVNNTRFSTNILCAN